MRERYWLPRLTVTTVTRPFNDFKLTQGGEMVIIRGLNIQHKAVLWYVADFSDRKPINFTTEYTGE